MKQGVIRVVMTLDDKDMIRRMRQNGLEMDRLKRNIDRTGESTKGLTRDIGVLGNKFRDTLLTISLLRYALHDVQDIFLALPVAIMKTSGEFERLQTLLKGVSGSATQAAKDFSYVLDLAQRSPFNVQSLADSFVKLKTGGVDPLNGSLQALVDGVAKFGGSSDLLKRASIAVQQMGGKGVVSMEELRQQMGEAIPTAMQSMADGMGITMARLTKIVSKGIVESTDAMKRMFIIMGLQNQGAADAMMKTWTGMVEQLSTKWELFKQNMGDQGLFDGVKAQVQQLIDAFGSVAANDLSLTIGNALNGVLNVLIQLKDGIIAYGEQIKLAGEMMLYYFAGSRLYAGLDMLKGKMAESAAAFKAQAAERQAEFDREVMRRQFSASMQAGYIAAEIEGNKQVIKADQDAFESRKRNIAETFRLEQDNNRKSIADRVNRLQELERLEQQFRNQRLQADLEADRLQRQKKAGTAAEAKVYRNMAAGFAGNEAIVAKDIKAERDYIQAMKARNDQLDRRIGLVDRLNHVQTVEQRNLRMQNSELATLHKQYVNVTKAVEVMTLSQRALNGVVAAGSVIWQAFGGWVGVVTMALSAGVMAWVNYKSAAEKAAEAVERATRAEQGFASAKDAKATQESLEELGDDINAQERRRKNPNGKMRPDGSRDEAWSEVNETEYQDNLKKREQLLKTLSRQRENIENHNAEQMKLGIQRRDEELRATYDESLTRQREQRVEAQKKEIEDAKKAGQTAKQIQTLQQKHLDDDKAFYKNQVNNNLAFINTYVGQAETRLAELNDVTEDKRDQAWREQKKAVEGRLLDLSKERADTIGTLNELNAMWARDIVLLEDPGDDKPKGVKADDPIISYLNDQLAKLAEAKSKLQHVVEETRSIGELRHEAAFSVLGDVASGKFDKTGKGGYKFGGSDRGQWSTQLQEFLQKGKGDVSQFVDSLTSLTAAQKKQINAAIGVAASLAEVEEQTKALTTAQQIAARTHETMQSAMDEFTLNGMAKETRGMMQLNRQFGQLTAKLRAGTQEFEAFHRKRAEAFANQAIADSRDFASTGARDLAQAEIDAIPILSARRQAEHELNMRRIQAEFEMRQKAILDTLQLEGLAAEDRKRLEDELNVLQQGYAAARRTELLNFATSSKTELEHLRDSWRDITEQMNQTSAGWADTMMDHIEELTRTGKTSWRDMVVTMLEDLNAALVRNAFGDMVIGAAEGMQSMVKGLLNLGGQQEQSEQSSGGFLDTLKNGVSSMLGGGKSSNNGMPIDTARNAMRVTLVDNATAGDLLGKGKAGEGEGEGTIIDQAIAKVKSVTDNIGERFKGVIDNVSGWFGETFSGLKDSLGGIFKGVGGWLSNLMSGGGGGGGGIGSWISTAAQFVGSFFADGGIMTQKGSVPLKKYAKGGIAKTPQLAMFGEGSTPEAYVPLPDGRTIPVTIAGGTGGAGGQTVNNQAVNIEINVYGGEGEEQSSSATNSQTWDKMAGQIKNVVLETLVKEKRPGGLLRS